MEGQATKHGSRTAGDSPGWGSQLYQDLPGIVLPGTVGSLRLISRTLDLYSPYIRTLPYLPGQRPSIYAQLPNWTDSLFTRLS